MGFAQGVSSLVVLHGIPERPCILFGFLQQNQGMPLENNWYLPQESAQKFIDL